MCLENIRENCQKWIDRSSLKSRVALRCMADSFQNRTFDRTNERLVNPKNDIQHDKE